MSYEDFIAGKVRSTDFDACPRVGDLLPSLFPHQRALTDWALRRGRAAIFADTGLGKSLMEAEWSRHVSSVGRVLILAPLAVTDQLVREADRFGISMQYARRLGETDSPIVVTNYDLLEHFVDAEWAGVVLDECFAPNTRIDTPCGPVAIRDLRIGDEILNASGIDVVSDVHRREVPYGIRVTIAGQRIICSPNHPFFTQRGWVGAQDLEPDDSAVETAAAVRMVRNNHSAEGFAGSEQALLQSILLSEMADAATRAPREGAYARGCSKARSVEIGLAEVGPSGCRAGSSSDSRAESNGTRGRSREDLPPIERDGARTFRAWRKRAWHDHSAAAPAGSAGSIVDGGVCLVTGATDSRLSHELQTRLGARRSASRYRGGWVLAPQQEGARQEEGQKAGFARVDGIEVLESGHPDLDRFRSADGKLYFYDLGGTRHPSFSVAGCLVHNSSILKAFDGKTRNTIIGSFAGVPYRLACTATPAPNDFTELGNHSEFLGVMSRVEMLAEYFVHDGGDTSEWRLKGHAEELFWRWVCTWGAAIKRPSDIGFNDGGYALPPLEMHEHVIAVDHQDAWGEGHLFAPQATTLSDQRATRRMTMGKRVELAAELAQGDEPVLVWCELNAEADAIERAIPGAVQVKGSQSPDEKRALLNAFAGREARVMVTKASVAGYGLNWQHCAKVIFAGASHSFELTYQAIRRCWRFGQERPVHVHVIRAETESAIVQNFRRKEADAERLSRQMVAYMREAMTVELGAAKRQTLAYTPSVVMTVPAWAGKEDVA